MALLYIPSFAFKEYEMIELIQRHIRLTDYPIEVEYNELSSENKKIISFKNKEVEKTVDTRTLFTQEDLHNLLQSIDLNQKSESIRLASTSDLSIVLYRDALLLASESVKTTNSATLNYEAFFEKVLDNPTFPIELTFCFGGTIPPPERVYRLTLENSDWDALIETNLISQLQLPAFTLLIRKMISSTPKLDVFKKTYTPTKLGNFVMSRDAANHYHFLDHVNETIMEF